MQAFNPNRNLHRRQSPGKIRVARNGHIAERTPIVQLKAAALYLQDHPACTDAEIAHTSGIARRTCNTLRHVAQDTPQHLPYVLSGELSLDAAMKLRRKMKDSAPACNGVEQPFLDSARSEVIKLVNDLHAWMSLTRELVASIEKVMARLTTD